MFESYVPTESEEQITVFQWAEIASIGEPRLQLMYHVPNGGIRPRATAARLQAEGVRPGVPDICLPVPSGKYHGLYIEMKKRDHSNRASKEQVLWINRLREQGYRAEVCFGSDQAIETIMEYLDNGEVGSEK